MKIQITIDLEKVSVKTSPNGELSTTIATGQCLELGIPVSLGLGKFKDRSDASSIARGFLSIAGVDPFEDTTRELVYTINKE